MNGVRRKFEAAGHGGFTGEVVKRVRNGNRRLNAARDIEMVGVQ
jgi:hypothetical protein